MNTMQYIDKIPVFGEHEANTLKQARVCAQTADHFALMADGHLGYGVPIGGVIARLLGARIEDEVHNHHNYAWLEERDGKQLWVCRKGATPAFPGQHGLVGGTMGEQSVVLEGVTPDLTTVAGREAEAKQNASLYSTVHGAGRVMGRKQAAGVRDRKTGAVKREGLVTPEMMNEWLQRLGVVLKGGGLDESPHCYKRLDQVLVAHSKTVRVLHTLTPIGVAMAGAEEFDPYKD